MEAINWKDHIHSDAKVLLGKPIIKGTRISVELILELFSQSWSIEKILESYPNITEKDIVAILNTESK